jgi:hypothetical protein
VAVIDFASGLAMVPIWIVGIVLAFLARRRHPQVALAAGLAFTALIVLAGIQVAIFEWRVHHEADGRFQQSLAFANHIVFPLVSAITWIVLLCAVFGWRGQARMEEPRRPQAPSLKPLAAISRQVLIGAFIGACFGAMLSSILCETTPDMLIQLGATTSIAIVLVTGWGAVAGAAVAATQGAARGAILGGAVGLVVVFAWAANQIHRDPPDPQGAAWVLSKFPVWFVLGGVALGWALARGWQTLNRQKTGRTER